MNWEGQDIRPIRGGGEFTFACCVFLDSLFNSPFISPS